jgi:hypothetical protein
VFLLWKGESTSIFENEVLGGGLMIELEYERQSIGYTYVYKMLERCKFYNDGSN